MEKFNNISFTEETVASELIVLCEGIKSNITKFSQAQSYLEILLNNTAATGSSS